MGTSILLGDQLSLTGIGPSLVPRARVSLKANTWLAASYLWIGCAAARGLVDARLDLAYLGPGRPPNYLRKPETACAYWTKLRYEARASI